MQSKESRKEVPSLTYLMLRCQAQLELTLMMCLSDRSTFLARLVTVLLFGALSDRSTFTLTDARATVLRHGLFGGTRCRL